MDKITLKEVQRNMKRNGYADTLNWIETDKEVQFPKTLEFFNVNAKEDTAEVRTSSGSCNVEDYGQAMLYIKTETLAVIQRAEEKFPDCMTGIKTVYYAKDKKSRHQFQHCFWNYDNRKANVERKKLENKKLPERK